MNGIERKKQTHSDVKDKAGKEYGMENGPRKFQVARTVYGTNQMRYFLCIGNLRVYYFYRCTEIGTYTTIDEMRLHQRYVQEDVKLSL